MPSPGIIQARASSLLLAAINNNASAFWRRFIDSSSSPHHTAAFYVCINVEQGKRQVDQDLFAHEGMEEAIIAFITPFFLRADNNSVVR